MVNGPSKNARLAKFKPNSRGLVSYFYGGSSRSIDFFFNAKEVSGSQKMYQSRPLAKSRIYHSTPPLLEKSFVPHNSIFIIFQRVNFFKSRKGRLQEEPF